MNTIQQFDTEFIESRFTDDAGIAFTGATPLLCIRRKSDGLYFNGSALVTGVTLFDMSEVNNNDSPGFYQYKFDTTGLPDACYTITSNLTSASNTPQIGELQVGGFVDDIGATQGGSSIVHLEGVFTKKEKEKLMSLIADSISELTIIVNGLSTDILTIASRINSVEDKLDRNNISEKIDEMQKYIELQTKMIEQVGDENTMIGEINV